jgi:hypothetical protein
MSKQSCKLPEGIRRIRWNDYTKERFHDEFVVTNTPCVIEGAIADWPALEKWQDAQYLVDKIGAQSKFMVELVNKRYLSYHEDENRRLVDARLTTTFGEFVKHCMEHTELEDGDLWYCSQQNYPILSADFSTPNVMLKSQLLTTPYAWIAQVGAGPGLHVDMVDNVLCQIRGDKRVVLISPEDTHFCYPRADGQSNFSAIPNIEDLAQIKAKFPLFAQARQSEVVLKPGDSLFIPANWWHEIWALTPFCISVNFFFEVAGGQDIGSVTLDEFDVLEQVVREKFKKMNSKFREHFLRYFQHQHWALEQQSPPIVASRATTSTFYNQEDTSFNPVAMNSGTELLAKFLHGLIAMRSPRRILEYGAGYTTSQLIKSLETIREEHRSLQRIVKRYIEEIRSKIDPSDVMSMKNANIVANILRKEHYHYNLQNFLVDYEPDYVIIEDAGTEYYLKELKRLIAQSSLKIQVHFMKFTEHHEDSSVPGFDLIVNDSDEYYNFYVKYWDRLAVGGYLIFHQCYENFRAEHDLIIADLKARKADFTFINLQEPNKHMQNGCFVYQKVDLNSPKNAKGCSDDNVEALLGYIRDHPSGI